MNNALENKLDQQPIQLNESIETVCERFELSSIMDKPRKLKGGCINDMWTIRTEKGQYALRKINKENYRLLEKTILPEEQAENLAFHHQQRGLLTRVALKSSHHQTVEQCQHGHYWMVFPWIEGSIKEPPNINCADARIIAELLIKIQSSAPTVPGLSLPNWFGFSKNHWTNLILEAEEKSLSWALMARSHEHLLNEWSAAASEEATKIQKNLIVSHRDLSFTNVIWTPDNRAVVIDWEYSGLVNPESEIFNTAMTWAYQAEGQFNSEIFKAFIDATKISFTLQTSTLIAAYAGYLLEWCEFNMQRSCRENKKNIVISTNQIFSTISILSNLSG